MLLQSSTCFFCSAFPNISKLPHLLWIWHENKPAFGIKPHIYQMVSKYVLFFFELLSRKHPFVFRGFLIHIFSSNSFPLAFYCTSSLNPRVVPPLVFSFFSFFSPLLPQVLSYLLKDVHATRWPLPLRPEVNKQLSLADGIRDVSRSGHGFKGTVF